ncbi:PH domain-containing protein [Enterococcus dispar]|uniref:PH domain-containing protein n=1 Tax=Enterococcus dispar TaxID=44009 RepID=UPI0021D48318|nr:PH domain-containing protein [Enterococcus dispar]MCU7356684.1 PH domain-containing protein [Enterococcus dispar]
MKFCPECGTNVEGMKFCPNCGYKIGNAVAVETPVETPTENGERVLLVFSTYMFGMEGKKKNLAKNIDLSIPQMKYTLTTERLKIEKVGTITTKKDEIELFKIKDVVFKQGLKDKVMGVGDITLYSSDSSTPEHVLKFIKDPENVKEQIRRAALEAKSKVGVRYREEL